MELIKVHGSHHNQNMLLYFGGMLFKQEDEVAITANSLHPGAIATNLFRHSNLISGIDLLPLFFFLLKLCILKTI